MAARFNEIVVSKLLSGAIDGLVRHNVKEENITAAWVPGAFELPTVAKKMAESGKYDAVIVLGAVIRGQTSPLRACVQRGCKRNRSDLYADWCANYVWSYHDREY